jgi:molybdopterin/thiamine biosynthesis adenylyltransferase
MIVTKKDKNLHALIEKSSKKKSVYLPSFYRLRNENDQKEFDQLIAGENKLEVFDELHGQLQELVKSMNPKIEFKKNPEILEQKVKEHLGDTPAEQYGVWVYYPWSSRLLHILDKKEFIAVRTNRNLYKITAEEQNRLAGKKVGVMGLSVGQSVAITMAMERGFGEIRLADFDVLELTNYNRIRTGLHNMGINKAVSTAREIAEIDPFLSVKCFTDGITDNNMNDFLTQGGKLDLLIDECDGLDIKILSRSMARQLQIPVIMEASDRSAIDVERFDLEPQRPILHGWLDHLDISKVREARTNEEKIPYLLAMLKLDTVSPKLKATMLEIEQTVTTWPQLASEVTGGGGIMANIARRINLNQFSDSGRYYVDIDELIADKVPAVEKVNYTPDPASFPPVPLTNQQLKSIAGKTDTSLKKNQADPDRATVEQLVALASLAPSGGNNQPWKWLYFHKQLFLFHDASRSVSFVDYDNVAANVSLGATIESMVLAAQQIGFDITVDLLPQKDEPSLVAACRFYRAGDAPVQVEPRLNGGLNKFIDKRCTNRQNGNKAPLLGEHRIALTAAVNSVAGAAIQFADGEKFIQKAGHIITAAERLRFMHPQGHQEFFKNELRWNQEEYELKRDGIDLRSLNLTASEGAGMQLAEDERVIALLRKWQGGKGFEKISKKAVDSASAFALITMPAYTPDNYLMGGRAVQRMWLTATKNNIAVYPMTGPLFLFPRLMYGNGIGMTDEMIKELKLLREEFAGLFSLEKNVGEIFLFRLCYAEEPVVKSLRRSVKDIFCFEA